MTATRAFSRFVAFDRYYLLEEENRVKTTYLEKARVAAKEARSKIRETKEELNQATDIVSGKPFLLRTTFEDPKYVPLDRLWSSADAYMDLAASATDATVYFKDQKGPKWKSCSGHSSTLQSVCCC